MRPLTRFVNYAIRFEIAYGEDDFSEVGPYFHEDAEYLVTGGPPFDRKLAGRDAIVEHYTKITRSFDRRFARREPMLLDGPTEDGSHLQARWAAIYSVEGAPPLRLEGEFLVDFDGELIRRYEERNAPGSGARVIAWLGAHGSKLAAPRS